MGIVDWKTHDNYKGLIKVVIPEATTIGDLDTIKWFEESKEIKSTYSAPLYFKMTFKDETKVLLMYPKSLVNKIKSNKPFSGTHYVHVYVEYQP